MGEANMGYYSTRQAAEKLGCSPTTISRAARKTGLGIWFRGGRLAALSPADLAALKPHIQAGPGNPDWIAEGKKRRKNARPL
jgi:hypothetical protein